LVVASLIAEPPAHLDAQIVAGGLISLVPFLLLPWRPRIPEGLLAVSVACGIGAAMLGVTAGSDIVALVAVYTIGSKRSENRTYGAVAIAWLGSVAAVLLHLTPNASPAEPAAGELTLLVCFASVAWLGQWINKRRTYMRGLVDRAEDLERERSRLETEREELARRAVAEERARIARELHDVVAHHVSVMVIQAGAAEATLPPGAEAVAPSLEAIRQTGREALAEMRRMLGLLRAEGALEAGAAAGDSELAPQPGLDDVDALVARMREAGLVVELEPGTPRRLPPGVGLSAYRVVQEALTNTLRHAGAGARVRVCLDYEPDALVVEVADDGRGRRTPTHERAPHDVGHGLVGMRERVALFGGTLEAGPRDGGGFRVRARFPIEAAVEAAVGATAEATPVAASGAGLTAEVRP
jgi:signal transduction histidine kinase